MKSVKSMSVEQLKNLTLSCLQELHNKKLQDETDPFVVIKGQEAAKRVLTIACCGSATVCAALNHTVLFVGPPGSGKSMLAAAGAKIGVQVYEMYPCPCGYFNSPMGQCRCSLAKVEKYWLSPKTRQLLKHIDLILGITYATTREMQSQVPGTNLDCVLYQRRKSLEYAKTIKIDDIDSALDDTSKQFINQFRAEIETSWEIIDKVKNVARTIAIMDGSNVIQGHHIAEALIYAPTIRRMSRW